MQVDGIGQGKDIGHLLAFSTHLGSSASLVTGSMADDIMALPWSTAPHPLWNPQTSVGSLPPPTPGDWLWFAFGELGTRGCL